MIIRYEKRMLSPSVTLFKLVDEQEKVSLISTNKNLTEQDIIKRYKLDGIKHTLIQK